jgi:hypothetical protein
VPTLCVASCRPLGGLCLGDLAPPPVSTGYQGHDFVMMHPTERSTIQDIARVICRHQHYAGHMIVKNAFLVTPSAGAYELKLQLPSGGSISYRAGEFISGPEIERRAPERTPTKAHEAA